MSDLLQVADLERAKLHDTFHSEVITGKAGGLASGDDIDSATNAVTGQVQKTLPKIINDLDWSPVGKFVDGVTFTKTSDFALDGDNTQWIYIGAASFPVTVAAGFNPVGNADYQVIHVSDHNQTTNRNAAGAHDSSAITLSNELTLSSVGFVIPDVDVTGVIDESAKVLAILNDGYSVKLPKGKIKLNILIPDGSVLLGSGNPRFDDTIAGEWDNFGTVINGSIGVSNKKSWTLANFSINDTVGNAVTGIGPKTGYGFVSRVNTRSRDHGFLFESATEFNLAGRDPFSDVVGNVIVQDCEHWGGFNGYVSKHHRVSFIRCKTYGVNVQGFVAVSDNINAATSYNRATDTLFEDCYSRGIGVGIGNSEGIRVYTQDRFSADPANDVNTHNVQPCDGTIIKNFSYDNLAGYPVRIGDYEIPTVAALNCTNNYVSVKHSPNYLGNIAVQHSRNTVIGNSVFGGGINVLISDRAGGVIFSDSNYVPNSATGAESGIIVVTDNSGQLKVRYWTDGLTYIYRNTVLTEILDVPVAIRGKVVKFIIDDEFTTIGFLFAAKYSGKGTIVDAIFDGTSWIAVNVATSRTDNSVDIGYSADLSVNYNDINYNNVRTFAAGNFSTITLDASKLSTGLSVGLLLQNTDGVTKTVAGWSANIMFASTAPTEILGFQKLFMKFDIRGTLLIETARTYYT